MKIMFMCDNILWQNDNIRAGEFQKSLKSACQSEVESGRMNVSHISVPPYTCNQITQL